MRINIYHELVYPYNKGGGEVQRFQIAKYLSEFGHNITLVGYRMPGTSRKEFVKGFCIKRVGPIPIHDAYQHLPRLLGMVHMFFMAASQKYDLMMSNPYFSLPATLPIAKLRRKPVAVTWDDIFGYTTFQQHKGTGLGLAGSLLEKLCLMLTRHADLVFTVSHSTKQKLVAAGIDERKIIVMHSGINPEDYLSPNQDVQKGAPKKKPQIVYLGRHVFYKNVEDLIHAFGKIAKNDKKTSLLILGYGTLTESYKQLAKDLGIDNRVHFPGFVSHEEKVKTLRESEILVLPSSFEGFGLAVIEANACATPYIAYDIPAVREVTEITKGGLLVKDHDVPALAAATEKLLSSARLRKQLAETGRKNVLKNFTWRAVAETVNRHLEQLVKARHLAKQTQPHTAAATCHSPTHLQSSCSTSSHIE